MEWIVDLSECESEIWLEEDVFKTKEEAIEEGKKLAIKAGNTICFRVGKKVEVYPDSIDAEDIIESIQDRTYSEIGEVAEDYLDNLTKEQVEELQLGLEEVYNKWLKKHSLGCNFFSVESEEIIYLNKKL